MVKVKVDFERGGGAAELSIRRVHALCQGSSSCYLDEKLQKHWVRARTTLNVHLAGFLVNQFLIKMQIRDRRRNSLSQDLLTLELQKSWQAQRSRLLDI